MLLPLAIVNFLASIGFRTYVSGSAIYFTRYIEPPVAQIGAGLVRLPLSIHLGRLLTGWERAGRPSSWAFPRSCCCLPRRMKCSTPFAPLFMPAGPGWRCKPSAAMNPRQLCRTAPRHCRQNFSRKDNAHARHRHSRLTRYPCEEVLDPMIQFPSDAVVRFVLSCICGTDLWSYHGASPCEPGRRIGHKFLGIIEEAGVSVTDYTVDDPVIAPFVWSDDVCGYCTKGLTTSCEHDGFWGRRDRTALRAKRYRCRTQTVRSAGFHPSDCSPHFLPVQRAVHPSSRRTCGGGASRHDGAVRLCKVLAAKRLAADRIIALERHQVRTDIARTFGATDIFAERGDAAVEAVHELIRSRAPLRQSRWCGLNKLCGRQGKEARLAALACRTEGTRTWP
ncbi:alcohol dehydrogenase catalytic domain-containing protein [Streptosporangium sp. NBC_01469]|uniref:alcohol dehydrogenase catalytic domain-containing protein n=1 Tax=Streptosporangium sp. NBC_01469 TaxID=2903898 RepID=UPI003FCC87AC